jgi:hypothetical protein
VAAVPGDVSPTPQKKNRYTIQILEKKVRSISYTGRIFTSFTGSTALFHGDLSTAGFEEHTDFSDESACLTADNIRNEVVTIHRSQEVLKIHVDIFCN